jgi:glutamate dehydrogenase (NAD(P)+)
VGRLSCRLVVQGANVPVTSQAEEILYERGIVSVPDFIANAGGVITGAVEYSGGVKSTAMAAIEEKVGGNTRLTLERARDMKASPYQAAMALATDRLQKIMQLRRWR